MSLSNGNIVILLIAGLLLAYRIYSVFFASMGSRVLREHSSEGLQEAGGRPWISPRS